MTTVNEDLEKQQAGEKPRTSLWHNGDYLLLWSGQAVSSTGSLVSQFAFPLLALALTRSPAITGIVAALGFVPFVVLSLFAGALADRWDRKRMMIVSDAIRAVCLASIPFAAFFGHLTIIQLGVVIVVEGALSTFFNIAQTASLPCVVTKEQLPAAVAQNEMTLNTAFTLGPFLGGFLLSLGRSLPFLLDAISYAISVLSLLFIKREFQQQRAKAPGTMWSEIGEGMQWLWHQPVIRFIALLCGIASLAQMSMELIVIVTATSWHASTFVIGIIFGVAGLGGILGSGASALALKRYGFGRIAITASWVLALCFPLFLVTSNLVVLGAIMAVFSTTSGLLSATQLSYRLSIIPDELRGRVSSVLRLISYAGPPIGFALTGALLQTVHLGPTVLLLFVVTLLLAVMGLLNAHVRQAPTMQAEAA
jgi:MFS family permease